MHFHLLHILSYGFYPKQPVQTPALDSPFLDTKCIYLLYHRDKNLRAPLATLCIYYIQLFIGLLSISACDVKALSKKYIHSSYWSAVSNNRVMQALWQVMLLSMIKWVVYCRCIEILRNIAEGTH